MTEAYICDALRTPIGRYGGALARVRPDDLLALVMRRIFERNQSIDQHNIDDVIIGCANQAGEDNRNIARMSALLAGLPIAVTGVTVNRLCGSGLDAIGSAARAIKSGEANLIVAGGVESMSRAPFVIGKADSAFSRANQFFDTTMGWRFVNQALSKAYGVNSMPETAENIARDFSISREDQDAFAVRSQNRALSAIAKGRLATEITPVEVAQKKSPAVIVDHDEHPRNSTLETLAQLPTPFADQGSVTAGNSSGINDGAAALIIASDNAVQKYKLTPRSRILATTVAGVEPRIMGLGPVPAVNKLLDHTGLCLEQIDLIELNEAFAAQALAVLRQLAIEDDANWVNPNGGAIAFGHPLGMSGARLALTATEQLVQSGKKRAICTMCIGVGQGIALALERV